MTSQIQTDLLLAAITFLVLGVCFYLYYDIYLESEFNQAFDAPPESLLEESGQRQVYDKLEQYRDAVLEAQRLLLRFERQDAPIDAAARSEAEFAFTRANREYDTACRSLAQYHIKYGVPLPEHFAFT